MWVVIGFATAHDMITNSSVGNFQIYITKVLGLVPFLALRANEEQWINEMSGR